MPPVQFSSRHQLRLFIRLAQIIVPLAALILLWPHLAPILLLLVLSLLLASVMGPVVNWAESLLGGNRLLAILGAYASIILVIIGLARTLAPILVNEAKDMASALEGQSVATLTIAAKETLIDLLPQEMSPIIEANIGSWVATSGTLLKSLLNDLAGIIGRFVGLVMNLILVLVFTFILLLEARNFKVRFFKAIPNAYFEMTLNLADKIHHQVSGYLRGQGIAALTVGMLSTAGLYLLSWLLDVNIPYAFIIGMMAGFANLIPFIGPFVGMVPAILAYLMTPQAGGIQIMMPLAIVAMFLIVQMIDNFFVSPKIMSTSVGMHPIVVIVVIMVGNSLMGPLGMLFAVPTFGVIKVTFTEVIWGLRNYRMI